MRVERHELHHLVVDGVEWCRHPEFEKSFASLIPCVYRWKAVAHQRAEEIRRKLPRARIDVVPGNCSGGGGG